MKKTLWDWLQLLIVPLVLAVVALVFQIANTRTEQQIAKQRYEQDQQIALDKQREDLLQAYLDRMSELLLEKNLRTSAPDEEVRKVARVRTTTVLFQLDARRIGYVFTFLRESKLMSATSNDNIVSLSGADLSGVNLSFANLSGALQSHF
ncbi:MAG TPA: pentapeptide repeat-containing protein [Ktedonobacteraceae bacterium]